jgi:acetyltransferase-like isoleucine patch superfamily enzyme
MTNEKKMMRRNLQPPRVKGFLNAIFEDMRSSRRRYEYLETIFRNIPGNFGVSLRSKFVASCFAYVGKNVVMWPGIRIKHPYKLSVGDNVQLGHDNHYQSWGSIDIGDDTLLGPGVKIWTMNHGVEDIEKKIKDQEYFSAKVNIGSDCWICSNVFITPGVTLPEGCVVLPNSVVRIGKFKPYSVIEGSPAKHMGSRKLLGRIQRWNIYKNETD